MTEKQIKGIGFKKTKSYIHDEFNTNRYKLGNLEVEFTYEGKDLITCDLTIEEINCLPITHNELQMLNKILNK